VNLFRLASISPFVRTFLQHIQAVGLPIAMAQAFDACNIRLVVQGETTGWNTPGKAVLLLGNHRSGFEQMPLMALLGSFQRSDMSIVAIPGIGAAKTFELLDSKQGSRYTLPVLPSLLAKDRKSIWNRFFFYRLLHYKSLPTRAALRENNLSTLSETAHLLEQGYAIVVFPTGRRDVDIRGEWQRGVGEIVSRLSAAARVNVTMALFYLEEDYSKSALAKAFVVRSLGRIPKQRSFTLRLGQTASCLDLVGQESDPQVITETVRKQYLDSLFG
jgi:1-acyl-sn-glycerol-3-phosphate acyltransferase